MSPCSTGHVTLLFLTLAVLEACEEGLPSQSGSSHLFENTSIAVYVSPVLFGPSQI